MIRLSATALLLAGAGACGSREAGPAPPVGEEPGRRLYLTQGCAACHGPDGRGDGPLAASLDPPPRDFRQRGAYKRGPAREQIERTLHAGLPGDASSPMPSYPHLTPEQRALLAQHVIALQRDRGPAPGAGGLDGAEP